MSVVIEVHYPNGTTDVLPFEVIPRTGEWVALPTGETLAVYSVVHVVGPKDFQAQIFLHTPSSTGA